MGCLPADKPWGVVSATELWRGAAGLCARVRVCAGAAESLHTSKHRHRGGGANTAKRLHSRVAELCHAIALMESGSYPLVFLIGIGKAESVEVGVLLRSPLEDCAEVAVSPLLECIFGYIPLSRRWDTAARYS